MKFGRASFCTSGKSLMSLVFVTSLMAPLPVVADELAEFESKVNSGDLSSAYQMAQSLRDQYEGDPNFDLQYAIAAVDSGHIEEGIFALERVLLIEPTNGGAKLELARAYFLLGLNDLAKGQFESVLEMNPPDSVRTKIDFFLDQIEQRVTAGKTRYAYSFELRGGYDDNINASPFDQTQLVTLSADALGRGDQFAGVKFSAKVDHQSREDMGIFADINLESRKYADESAQDNTSLNLKLGARWSKGSHQFKIAPNLQHYRLDGNSYRNLFGVQTEWGYSLTEKSRISLNAALNKLSYPSVAWRDSMQSTLGVSAVHVMDAEWTPVVFAGAFVGRESPDDAGLLADAGVDREFFGGHVGVSINPTDSLNLSAILIGQNSDYKGVDWLYAIAREDEFLSLNVDSTYRLSQNWSLLLGYRYTLNNSNIELYDYNRKQLFLGLRASF